MRRFFIVACFLCASTALRAELPRYDLVEIPFEWSEENSYQARINDEGQVLIFQRPASAAPQSLFLFLPEPDYDLAAGVHEIPIPEGISIRQLTAFSNAADFAALGGVPDVLGEVGFASVDRELKVIGDIYPLSLSDEGIVYGSTNANNSLNPDLVAYDTRSMRLIDSYDGSLPPYSDAVYESSRRIFKANKKGVFIGERSDLPGWVSNNGNWNPRSSPLYPVAATSPEFVEISGASSFFIDIGHRADQIVQTQPWPEYTAPFPIIQLWTMTDINDKGQVLGHTRLCEDCDYSDGTANARIAPFIYLPEADYGLDAGVHYFDDVPHLVDGGNWGNLAKLTTGGHIHVANQNFIWIRGDLVTPSNRLNSSQTIVPTRTWDLNNRGDVLQSGSIDGGPQKLYLLRDDSKIRATVSVSSRQVALGEEFHMDVAIENISREPFIVSGVYGESYRLIGTAAAGLLQLTNPPPTDSLLPGETFTQRFTYKGTQAGKLKFAFQAAGFFADTSLNLTDELITEEIQVGGDPVKIEFETLPLVSRKPPEDLTEVSIVDMKVSEDPDNPGQFIVTDSIPGAETDSVINPRIRLTITNVFESKKAVTATLQALDTRARDRTPLGTRAKIAGTFPIDLGKIEHGESVERVLEIDIRDDGRFDFSALITSIPEGSTEQYNTRRVGSPIAVGVPYPAKIEFKFDRAASDIVNQGEGVFFLTPGGNVSVTASVTNLTSNAKLTFFGLEAKKELNAFGAHLTSEEGAAFDPPFVHDHELDPEESVVLAGRVSTDALGAPSGTVTWQMPLRAFLEDLETGDKLGLSRDDFLIESDPGDWLDEELTIRLVQDNSLPPKADLTDLEYASLVIGGFSEAALITVGQWTYDSLDAIGGIGRVAGTVAGNPSLLSDKLGKGSRAVWETAELIHLGWTSMSDAEKEAFVRQAADDTFARAQLLVTAPFDKENYAAAYDFTNAAVLALMGGVSDAYASDDPEEIARLYGKITGNIAMEVIAAVVPEPKFTRFVSGGDLARQAKAADNVRNPFNTQQKILREIPSGLITRQTAIEGWGVGGKLLDDVQATLKKLGMKGYARERAPRSIELSETLGEAILKAPAIKPKGFNDLDRLIFGDNVPTVKGKDGADLSLEAITALIEPPNNASIRARVRATGASEDLVEAVVARAEMRRKEFAKRISEFETFKKDGVPIKFNYKDNDSFPSLDQNPFRSNRAFDFETIEVPGGGRIHVPKMANKDGNLRFITGDVDWIHFSWLDGTPLTSAQAGRLYDLLSQCCGLQHGETVSWINKGQAIFENKANQIGEYLTGQKALLEVTGDSIRASRVRPNLTRFAPDGRKHLIYFDGGTKSLRKQLNSIQLEEAFATLFDALPPKKVLLPFFWFSKFSSDNGDTTIDGQDWTYSGSGDAILAREVEDGKLERFDGSSWIPWDPKTDPNPNVASTASTDRARPANDEKIELTPTMVLADSVEAGAAILPIADFAEIWADELANHLDRWFEVGDIIVIAAGTSVQEVRRITSLTPFSVDAPLANAHVEDTLVAVVSESILQNLNTVDQFALKTSEPVAVEGAIAYEVLIPTGDEFVFELSSDLVNWDPISREELIGGVLLEGSAQPAYPGEPLFIILDTSGGERFLRWRQVGEMVSAEP